MSAESVRDFEGLCKALEVRVTKYITDCQDGVARNKHMNRCGGALPSRERIQDVLWRFLDQIRQSPHENFVYTSGQVLAKMTEIAKGMVRLDSADETAKAILVDYINYVGVTCGVDYALYTCDLD